jgi:hypothetical protein
MQSALYKNIKRRFNLSSNSFRPEMSGSVHLIINVGINRQENAPRVHDRPCPSQALFLESFKPYYVWQVF